MLQNVTVSLTPSTNWTATETAGCFPRIVTYVMEYESLEMPETLHKAI
jgi:hypothetical protein